MPALPRTQRRAMTLVEAILAMTVLTILLGSVAQAVSLSVRVQRSTAERVKGGILAAELIEYIAEKPYLDPEGGTLIGIDTGELAADRSTFDDVDDFDGWNESTVLRRDGTVRTDVDGWSRSVVVRWVSLGAPVAAVLTDTRTKKITVSVTHNGRAVASVDRLRCLGADTISE